MLPDPIMGRNEASPPNRSLSRGGGPEEWEAEGLALGVPRLGCGAGEQADAPDVALALGHADCAAGVQDVEVVAAFDDRVVGG